MLMIGCYGSKKKGVLNRPRSQRKPPAERAISAKTWRIPGCQLLLGKMGKGERKSILGLRSRMYRDQEVSENMACSRGSGARVSMCWATQCDNIRRYKSGEVSRHQHMRLS